jgi:23S rRNA (uracil1939-C5)-methyltransferase
MTAESIMQLTIEKLVYGGDGLARLAADERGPGKAIFVPFVLAGERVEAQVGEEKRGFARARAEKILEPSAERIPPACRYFEACGGCHYQHAGYDHQLAIKSAILRETLRRTAKLDWPGEIQTHPSPPWGYRNRARMHLRAQPFALGYHRCGSNTLLEVEECPISSPLINRAIAAVWQLGREGKVAAEVSEMEFFANAEDAALVVELTLHTASKPLQSESPVTKFAEALRAAMPEVTGIALFSPASGEALVSEDIPKAMKPIFGEHTLTYNTRSAHYRVQAGVFFQTNRFLIDPLVELVTTGRAGVVALDLYAGVGLFSRVLSQSFRELTAVEAALFAFHDLRHNSPANVAASHSSVEEFLAALPRQVKYDFVVVDPPRAGLGEKVARLVAALGAPRLSYVSCDPATLSRDLRVLLESGYRVEEVHLVDLFPQTFHIESVFHLARQS